MHDGVVGVGLQQEGRPVELHRGVVGPGGEHGVLLVGGHLEGLGVGGRDGRLQEAHHGRELPAVQRVAHEHHPLVPKGLQHQRRVEHWECAVVRLPAPGPVGLVRAAMRLAGELRLDVRAVLLPVQWVRLLVPHPAPREQFALFVLVLIVHRERQPPLPLLLP